MNPNLKLYIWHGVFTDYTDGIAFALAESAEDARQAIKENTDELEQRVIDRELAGPPDAICEGRYGEHLWGGG